MKTALLILLALNSQALLANTKDHFTFNNININALIGLICVGEENIATVQSGGGISSERLSISKWDITNYGDEILVQGICNAGVEKAGARFELKDGLELEIKFHPLEIKQGTGLFTAIGSLGSAEVQIVFNSQLDLVNRSVINKTTVESLNIAAGVAGARAGVLGQMMDALIPDIFRINSRNSSMSFCNGSARACRNASWSGAGNNELFYQTTGAGWLMNFGLKKIKKNLIFNAAKISEMGGMHRVPDFYCPGNEPCGGTVLLNASSNSVSACSKYKESVSWEMTESICRGILSRIY
jgi:hypothetical protein